MKKKKVHAGKSRQEKRILTVIAVLCALAVCVAGYGAWSMTGADRAGSGELHIGDEEIPDGTSYIKKVSIGDTYAEVVPDENPEEFRIEASLPIETDTTQISCTLELEEGAYLSEDSNCIINELGGQLLLNLGVEDARLVISDGETDQIYTIALFISE